MKRSTKNRFVQSISTLLSGALISTSLSLADIAHASAVTPTIVAQLAIPAKLGFVTDFYEGSRLQAAGSRGTVLNQSRASSLEPGAPLVIVIQDLHLHYSTQQGILKILNHLYAKNIASGPIAIEGLQGDYDTSAIASYPAGKTKEKLVDYFMRKGELSGDEAFAVLRGENHRLYGVDDGKVYQLNRELYRRTLAGRHALQGQLDQIKKELSILKKEHYSRELRKLDQVQPFDIRSAEEALQQKMAAAQAIPGAKEAALIHNIIQIDHSLFFLGKLLRQQTTLQEVRYIAQRLPSFVELTHKLLKLQSGLRTEDSGPSRNLSTQSSALSPSELEETLKSAVDFYVVALMRDQPLARHTMELLKTQGTVVLVAGGFPTAGVTKELKKAGVGYVVITPQVEAISSDYHAMYEARVAGQHV